MINKYLDNMRYVMLFVKIPDVVLQYRYIERLPTIKIYENIAYIKWISEIYIVNARFVK